MSDYFSDDMPLFDDNGKQDWTDGEKASGSARQVLTLLQDGRWHSTNEMLQVSTHRFACGIYSLRQKGYAIETRGDTKSIYEYRLTGKVAVEKVSESVQSRYYNTVHWRQRRAKRLELDNYKCCNCKGTDKLQVHHWRYDLFEERLGDLMTLCEDCHVRIHNNESIKTAFPKYLPVDIIDRIQGDCED